MNSVICIDASLEEMVAAMIALPIELLWPSGLHIRAWELARYFKRSAAYDMHYVALAEMSGCPFWTADERLYNAVKNELDWVHSTRSSLEQSPLP
jgi:predicted nucleic acid-binding protein